MTDIRYPEWRNNAQHVRYPFSDTATLVSGSITLDQDLFDDARLYPIGGSPGVYLNRIELKASLVTMAIADPVNGELASGSYNALSAPDSVELFDALGRPAGILVSIADKLSALVSQVPQGTTLFDASATPFAASVAVPMPQAGVLGLLVGKLLSAGETWLVGTDGIVLSMDHGNIRIDVIGDPYAAQKACLAQGLPLPVFCGLKTINRIKPDGNGDFKLFPGSNFARDNILRVSQDDAGNITIGTAVSGGGGCGG